MKTPVRNILSHTPYIILFVVTVILFSHLECHHKPLPIAADTITDISVKADTISITHNHYIPAPPPDTIIHNDTIFPDTSAILADYFALKIYNRTLLNDSTGKISLLDSLQFNSIRGSQFSAVLFQKHNVERITQTVYQPQTQNAKIFAGFTLGASYPLNNTKPILAPQVSILTKKDHLYSIAYDPINKAIYVNSLLKINKKKYSSIIENF